MADVNAAVSIDQSKIISTFDVDFPDVDGTLWRIKGNQYLSTFGRLKKMGRIIPIKQSVRKQYEEDWIHQTIYIGVGGLVSDGSNNYHFLTSVASGTNDYLTTNTTAPYDTTGQYITPVKQWDRIMLPGDNGAMLLVTSITGTGNALTVNCKSTSSQGIAAVGAYPAGTELFITGNAYSEGSDVGEGAVQKPLIDYSYSQIIKQPFSVTGSQLVTATWLKTYSDGGEIKGYYSVGLKNMEYEQQMSISDALMFEQLTASAQAFVDTTTTNPVQTTEGLIAYMIRKGTNLQYQAGTFSPTMFDQIDALLDAENAPMYMCGDLGISLDNEKDNALKAYMQGNANDYVEKGVVRDVFGGDEGKALQVKFKSIQKGYRTYMFSRVPEFSMKKGAGAAGYNYKGLGLFYPYGSKPNPNDPGGEPLPYFGMGYREMDGYSRMAEMITTAGAGTGTKVIHTDKIKYSLRSDISALHVGGNQMVRLYN